VLVLVGQAGNDDGGEPSTLSSVLKLESFTFGRAVGLGFLSGINPKNLLLCLGAGTTIGSAHLETGQAVVAMVVFTLLASSTVAVPVIGYLAARDRTAGPLEEVRAWLTQNNAAVMAVLLLVLGASLVGKGIGGF
jgi:threonine/homoserine/homoserine lactone efflux protein